MATGDRTKTTNYDNVGNADPIIVQSATVRELKFYENAKANTTSYRIYEPTLSAGPVTLGIGEPYIFKTEKPWGTGDIVGYCETVDVALAVFAQEEKPL